MPPPVTAIWLTDRFDMDMLPQPLPVSFKFSEISLEDVRVLLREKGHERTMIQSSAAAYVLAKRLNLTMLVQPNRETYRLRSYEGLIIAHTPARGFRDAQHIQSKLTPDEIERVPIQFFLVEILEISPKSW